MMDQAQPYVVCLFGPTAAGKTALAMALQEQLNGQLISVDSALIYRGMDIGTAKPSAAEQQLAPHRLIDICDPSERYSAADFATDAKAEIERALAGGKVPILVGGTMLYFKALLEGFSDLPAADEKVRASLQQQLQQQGQQALHARLQTIDPVSAARIHPNDPQRLLRALEVYELTGRSLTELSQQRHGQLTYPVQQIGLIPADRSVLHQRIELRFDEMLAHGFIDEVQALRARGDLHLDMPSMRCVGYRQVWQYLDGTVNASQMREQGVAATRQLAKRQLTWLRGWPQVQVVDPLASDADAQLKRALAQPACKYQPD